MNTEIRQQWLLPHPPQRVWHYLTTPELISKWLMQTDFRAEQGARFLFTAQPYPQYDFGGRVYCQVLELVPFE